MRDIHHFIDGASFTGASGRFGDVFNPNTGEVQARVQLATEGEVDRAVQAARTAFDDGRWSSLSPYQRERLISRLADLIEANIPELAELESIDNGKPRSASAGSGLGRRS